MTIDDRPYEAPPDQLVIDACEDAGVYVPRFCYHPRMRPVGMCRQCLVEVEGPRGPMMVVSCMTPVAEGQVVRTATPGIKRAQEGVLELLLANHPLDCPVCDKGGECPLQDQAFTHGPGESRYVEEKRHFEKPIPISELVYLDRERCILCDRCTRFADEVAGDPLISFTHRGNETQVLTFPDEPFASYFSGNTVQICPVGALTATPYRFKARPWDLEQVESTCTTCSVGCRIVVQSSRDELLRYQGVDSRPRQLELAVRPRSVQLRGRQLRPTASVRRSCAARAGWPTTIVGRRDGGRRPARRRGRSPAAGPTGIAMLGGARGTNEDAFAWARLRRRARRDRTATPSSATGCRPSCSGCPRATIDEAAAAHHDRAARPRPEGGAARSSTCACATPPSSARPGSSSSARWTAGSRRTPGGSIARRGRCRRDGPAGARRRTRSPTSSAAGPVVVVAGRGNLAESAAAVDGRRWRAVLAACPGAKVLPALRRGNVVGALQLGLAPDGDGLDGIGHPHRRRRGSDRPASSCSAPTRSPTAPTPTSPAGRWPAPAAIIAVDTFLTESSQQADVVLAAAAFGEKDGTTTNLEGRVTTVARKVTPHGTSRPDWMIAAELAERLGHVDVADELLSVDAITDAIAGHGARLRRRHPRRAGATSATACWPCRRPTAAASTADGGWSRPPTGSATTTGSW